MMKAGKLITVIVIMLAVISLECNAQPPAPARLSDGPPPRRELERQALQQVSAFTGQAGEWTSNDDYIYDGFYLQTSQGKSLVKFPPHLGLQLTKAIKAGAGVTVNGVEDINPEGVKEIRMISIVAGGQTILDAPPAATVEPEQNSGVTGSGKVTGLHKGQNNEVKGYIIDGKTILRVPPHVAGQLTNLVTEDSTISFTGMKKSTAGGEASAGNYSIIHCQTISVNGTQYLTR